MGFFTGSAVWAHQGWVGNFFPKGTKQADYLREYARRLTTVEGNTTFYATPSVETVLRWAQDTPADFRFCPKLPRGISHAGQLMPHLSEAQRFVDLMRNLGTRLGPLFLQLPPRYSPRLSNDLQKFLAAWPREVKLALEVRHLDWFGRPHHSALNDLLRAHDVARVLIDMRPIRDLPDAKIEGGKVQVLLEQAQERKPDVPLLPERTASFAFVRYIGSPSDPSHFGMVLWYSKALVRANTLAGTQGGGGLRVGVTAMVINTPGTPATVSPSGYVVTAANRNVLIGNNITQFNSDTTYFPLVADLMVMAFQGSPDSPIVQPIDNVFVGSGGRGVTYRDQGIGTRITGYAAMTGGAGHILHDTLTEAMPPAAP